MSLAIALSLGRVTFASGIMNKGADHTILLVGQTLRRTDTSASSSSIIIEGAGIGGLSVSSPSHKLINDLNALQARILQKAHDEQIAKEKAEEQAQEDAQAALLVQQQQEQYQVPVVASQPVQSDYYVNWIIQHESGGNPYAVNASSGACGLFQRYPCSVPLGDVATQMSDGLAYIASRYGSPYNAYLYWIAHGNY